MFDRFYERNEIHVCAKSVGNILKEEKIKNRHTHKAPRKRRTRERRDQEGELVQIDASPFDWLEVGKRYNLHGAIDDATGKVLAAHFEPTETMKGYSHVLEDMVKKHGIPGAIYSDRHTIFFSQLHGETERRSGIWNGEIYDLVLSPSAPVITTKTKPERKKSVPAAEHPWRRWNRKTKANRHESDWQVKTAV